MGKKYFFSFPKAAVLNSGCKLESPRGQWGEKIPCALPRGIWISFIRDGANCANSSKSFLSDSS